MDVWFYGYSYDMGFWLSLIVLPVGLSIVCFVGWLLTREKK